MQPPRRLLLTGATGFLGHYVLGELLGRCEAVVRVLIRGDRSDGLVRLAALMRELGVDVDAHLSSGRLEVVEGSLPDSLDVQVLSGVDTIVHSAASTRFQSDSDGDPSRTNVDGTRVLLDAAAMAGVQHFVYVSTAYVCGDFSGRVSETLSEHPPAFCNAYEASKMVC